MARRCSICDDPRIADIDKALDGPLSRREIAQEFSVPKHRLDNHATHRARKVDVSLPKEQTLHDVTELWTLARKEYDGAKDPKVRLGALQRMQGLFELRTRLQQEASGTGALESDPAFQQIMAAVGVALCPSCKDAVSESVTKILGTPLSHAEDEQGEGGYPDGAEEGGGGGANPTDS